MCDEQINCESLESCLLHEYKLKHSKFKKYERNQVSVVILSLRVTQEKFLGLILFIKIINCWFMQHTYHYSTIQMFR